MFGKMLESGLTEIMPSICTSTIWGQCPGFSYPEFPQGSPLAVIAIAEDLDILCLLISSASRNLASTSRKIGLQATTGADLQHTLKGVQSGDQK